MILLRHYMVKMLVRSFLTVDFADSEVKVRGFIGKPTLLKMYASMADIAGNGRIIT